MEEHEADIEPLRDDAIHTLEDHRESVFCVVFDSSGRFLVTGAMDHQAYLYDTTSYEKLFHFTGHDDSVTCLVFNHNSRILASGDMAGKVQVWFSPPESPSTNWIRLAQFNTSKVFTRISRLHS
ncbi:hypothetical protein Ciccas_010948 [Cichlidogyrus casuarinus]|uniref:Uncharacterized protein n=1 Tax=Cichlidogyrus casuarinus TaxID=1844966 RepID=A0ABD2PSQ4_9PLAT